MNYGLAAKTFYDELFRAEPEMRKWFKNSARAHQMFMGALRNIDDLETNDQLRDDYLAHLGTRHKQMGLTQEQMNIGRAAFDTAISTAAPDLDTDQRQRYVNAFSVLQGRMGY